MKTIGRKTVKGDKVSAPKAVKATSSKTAIEAKPATAAVPAPSHAEIAQRSYELYLARGSVDGHAEEDWARAEAELGTT
jgi:hypothetical protein